MDPLNNDQNDPVEKNSARTYWIQARTGDHWRNLESLADTQAAISRLGVLVSQQAYDELKLVEARFSPITGRTDYTHVVTIEGGEVVESIDAGSAITRNVLSQSTAYDRLHSLQNEAEQQKQTSENGGQQEALDLWRRDEPKPVSQPPKLRVPAPTALADNAEGDVAPENNARAIERASLTAQLRAQLPLFNQAQAPHHDGLTAPPLDRDDAPNARLHEPFLRRASEEADALSNGTAEKPNTDLPGTDLITPSETPLESQVEAQSAQQTYDMVRGRFRDALIPEQRRDEQGMQEKHSRRRRNGIMSSMALGAFAAGLTIAAIFPNAATTIFNQLVGGPILGTKSATVAVPSFATLPPSATETQAQPAHTAEVVNRDTESVEPPLNVPNNTMVAHNNAPETPKPLSLIEVASSGNLPALRARLADGADPNSRNDEGIPVLLIAAKNGPPSMVSALLRYGADPVLPVGQGRTVLHNAAENGLTEAVRLMVGNGAPVDTAGGAYGCLTPLGLAANAGWLRTSQVLTELGASLTPQPGCDVGPLQLAVENPMVLEHFATVRAQRIAAKQGTRQEDLGSPRASDQASQASAPVSLVAGLANTPKAPLTKSVPQQSDKSALRNREPGNSTTESAVVSALVPTSTGIRAPRRSEPLFLARASEEDRANARTSLGFTASDETIGSSIESASFSPQTSLSTEPVSLEPLLDRATIQNAVQRLIDGGEPNELASLLDRLPDEFDPETLNIKLASNGRTGWRPPVDHAILSGKNAHAAALIANGFKPSDTLIHTIVQTQSEPSMRRALGLVLAAGADANARSNGETPLMIAAASGDIDFVDALLRAGANPNARSTDGRLVGDFARESKVTSVQEQIALAANGPAYDPLLFGLSWEDTQQSAGSKIEVCRDVGDGFTACKLDVAAWIDDIAAVVAQFDMEAGGRLVAIQLDSNLYSNELVARQKFEEVIQNIQSRVPTSQAGFPLREIAAETPFFEGLKPSVSASEYYHYWPDQDGMLSAFIQLKMIGHKAREGFFRVIIGNPFRVG